MNQGSYTIANRTYEIVHPLDEELHFDASNNFIFDLPHLSVLGVNGDKASLFLQGQVTCDLRDVTSSSMQRGALCNLKGRTMALLDVIHWHGYHLLLPEDLIDEVKHSLAKVAMLSRVTLQEQPQWQAFGFLINNSNNVLPQFELPVNAGQVTAAVDYCCYYLGNNLFLALIHQEKASHYLQDFPSSQRRGSLAWHYLQLLNHHVTIYPESRGLFLPHRIDLHKQGYISFDKGCYKGQEIIARTHYKAKLKHELQIFTILTHETPVIASRLFIEGTQQEIGELIDFCPKGNNYYLIAVSIHFEHAQVVTIENHKQTITLLDPLVG